MATCPTFTIPALQHSCSTSTNKLPRLARCSFRNAANRNYSFRYKQLSEQEQALQKQVEQMLAEAAQIDAEEDAQYGKGRKPEELPEELRSAETRLAKIREIRQRLQREAEERAVAARKE